MKQRSIDDVFIELMYCAYHDGWCNTDTFSQATLDCLARALQVLTKQNNHEPVSSVPKPKPLGTVNSLFDARVIEYLGLDRTADVYLAPVSAEPVNAQLLAALRLAKDMFIANDLSLPRTFEVIDEAIDAAMQRDCDGTHDGAANADRP